MPNLKTVEGIGPRYAAQLATAGVTTTQGLLEAGASPKGRKDLAAKSGLSEKLILEWVNHCDLFRIKGVGGEYADLLEASGVDTIVELATRRADNLCAKMVQVNAAKKLVRKLPTENQVAGWVQQAKGLPRVVKY